MRSAWYVHPTMERTYFVLAGAMGFLGVGRELRDALQVTCEGQVSQDGASPSTEPLTSLR